MNRYIALSILLCTIIGIILTMLGVTAAKLLLHLLNTPVDIVSDATKYLTTMVCGTLIVMGYNMCASILRGLGDGRTPLAAMIIAAIINIVLDCLFVFVFKWGLLALLLRPCLHSLFL